MWYSKWWACSYKLLVPQLRSPKSTNQYITFKRMSCKPSQLVSSPLSLSRIIVDSHISPRGQYIFLAAWTLVYFCQSYKVQGTHYSFRMCHICLQGWGWWVSYHRPFEHSVGSLSCVLTRHPMGPQQSSQDPWTCCCTYTLRQHTWHHQRALLVMNAPIAAMFILSTKGKGSKQGVHSKAMNMCLAAPTS